MKYITEYNPTDLNIAEIMCSPIIGFDIEATSLDPRKGTLLSIQIATLKEVYVFNATKMNCFPMMAALEEYKGIIVIQNGKFDLQYIFHNFGFWWQGNFYDPYLAHRLKNVGYAKTYEEKFVGLDKLCKNYINVELNKGIRDSFQYSTGELTENQIKYGAKDAEVLIPLYYEMKDRVLERQPEKILKLEFNTIPVTAMMEYYGIRLGAKRWSEIAQEKTLRRTECKKEVLDVFSNYIDWDININSWQQLLKAFKILGFKLPNTQAKTINKFKHKHEIFKWLAEYKQLQKAVSTYGFKYLGNADENGDVYASFSQLGTDTGRYSCSKPNLQQVPVRADSRYREAFVAREGYSILTSDLSQAEYRAAGEFSGEKSILTEYNKESPDFHQLTATQMGEALGSTVERFVGKTANFALIYQGGPGRLVDLLECDMKTAKKLHKAYWEGYSTLKNYVVRKGYETLTKGYSETFWGRRRYFYVPQKAPRWLTAQIMREGGNMPMQGSVADLLKAATVYMFPQLVEYGARLVLQVHDELVVEVPTEKLEEVTNIVESGLIKAGNEILFKVPTIVDSTVKPHWAK